MKFLFPIAMMATLAALAGCDGVAGNEHGEPYLVLEGKITNEQAVSAPEGLRVALLWVNEEPEDDPYGAFKIAQETEINSEFPTFFKLSVHELPPEGAMMDLGELFDDEALPPGLDNARMALGSIIVYHDGNDNHQLDLLDDEATESIDTVLGTPRDLIIVYLEGGSFSIEEDGASIHLDRGFNLLELPDSEALDACYAAGDACFEQSAGWEEQEECWNQQIACTDQVLENDPPETVALDTEIVIDLSSDPSLATMLCEAGGIESSGGSSIEDLVNPMDPDTWPEEMLISCSADGRSFDYSYEVVSGSICKQITMAGAGNMEWPPMEPLPDWWPCEVP